MTNKYITLTILFLSLIISKNVLAQETSVFEGLRDPSSTATQPALLSQLGNKSINREDLKEKAVKKVNEVRAQVQEQKTLKIQNKTMLDQCDSEEVESNECVRVKTASLENLKVQLLSRIDGMESQATRLINNLKNQDSITDDELNTVLNDYLALLEEFRLQVEAAETTAELRSIFQNLNAQRQSDLMRKLASFRMSHSYRALYNSTTMLERHVQRISALAVEAETVGHDVSEATEFIALAQTKIVTARELLDAQDRSDFEATKLTFMEVREMLKSAHEDLRRALILIKELYSVTPWDLEGGE
jgi:hypothetical protein